MSNRLLISQSIDQVTADNAEQIRKLQLRAIPRSVSDPVAADEVSVTGATDWILVAAVDTVQSLKDIADYVCDGVADNVEINAALATPHATGAGPKVRLLPGTFTLDGFDANYINVHLTGTWLAGSGWHSVIKKPNNNVSGVIRINNGSLRCRVTDLRIQRPLDTSGPGVYVDRCNEAEVTRCKIEGGWSGITVAGNLNDPWIHHNFVDGTGLFGIQLSTINAGVRIEDNTFIGSSGGLVGADERCVEMAGGAGTFNRVSFKRNIVKDFGGPGVMSGGGPTSISYLDVIENTFIDCARFTNNSRAVVEIGATGLNNTTVALNKFIATVANVPKYAVNVFAGTNNDVVLNHMIGDWVTQCIITTSSTNTAVWGNRCGTSTDFDVSGVSIGGTPITNGHVIEDEGTPIMQRANMNFVGGGVTVTDAGGKTVVTIPDVYINDSLVNAKGDLITATADDTPARLAVGADRKILTADSGEATGLKWEMPTKVLGMWVQDLVSASQTAVALNLYLTSGSRSQVPMMRVGSVTGIVVRSDAARIAGTLTVEVTINGAGTGLTAVLDGTNTIFKATTQVSGLDTYAVGDEIGVTVTTDVGWLPITANISADVEISE